MDIRLFFDKVQKLLDRGFYIFNEKTADLTQQDMIVLASVVVLGLAICFYGLKLVRIWGALLGFFVGGAAGLYACLYFNLSTNTSWVIGLISGLILAGLSAWLYKMGVFLVSWGMGMVIAIYLAGFTNMPVMLICVGIGFVVGLIGLKLAAPVVIVITGLTGGIAVGQAAFRLLPINIQILHIVLSVVLTTLGIIVQFLSESKKRKELHLKKAEEIRKANSMANEVDKARSMLDSIDSEPFADNSIVSGCVDFDHTEENEVGDEKTDKDML